LADVQIGQLSFAFLGMWKYKGWENSSCFTAWSVSNPFGNGCELSVEIWAVVHQKLDQGRLQAAGQPMHQVAISVELDPVPLPWSK